MALTPVFETILREKLFSHVSANGAVHLQVIGGGSINNTYRVSVADKTIFCKVNSAPKFPQLFAKEKAGLLLLAQQQIVHTPTVIDCFEVEGIQCLFLEWIKEGERTDEFWKKFGQQLATLHSTTDQFFGLNEDNYMGSVPQANLFHDRWDHFFWFQRLMPMLKRCSEKGFLQKKHFAQAESLQKKLPQIFGEAKPSLLHGDLWSGNFMCNERSEPVLIDPAVYYGHRSVDLAMTTLFGGFRQPFYESYHYHFPFPANYQEQWAVCNLYPLLIHLYLFGSSYLSQVESTLKRFA